MYTVCLKRPKSIRAIGTGVTVGSYPVGADQTQVFCESSEFS